MNSVHEKIQSFLRSHGVRFRECHHEPTRTSEESAAARGEDLQTGAKALLLKIDEAFQLFVMPANRKLNSKAIKRELGCKRIRFATPDELLEMTGLVPGSVPPFGPPILPFELYVDVALEANERVAFNAGSLTDSIIMEAEDYLKLCEGKRFAFSK